MPSSVLENQWIKYSPFGPLWRPHLLGEAKGNGGVELTGELKAAASALEPDDARCPRFQPG